MTKEELIVSHLEGWASPEKLAATCELIAGIKPVTIVEIGTFGGKWLIPVAMAAPDAKCHAIDPYSAGACVEGMTTEQNKAYWSNQNMLNAVKAGFLAAVRDLELQNITLHQMTSAEAVAQFADGSIDILHSDGNHSAEPTMRDLKLWLPKVRVGGVVIQDDIQWTESGVQTVWPALMWALGPGGCEWVKEVTGAGFMRKVK
jgi:predicted O-methyltransferase YrrM